MTALCNDVEILGGMDASSVINLTHSFTQSKQVHRDMWTLSFIFIVVKLFVVVYHANYSCVLCDL